MGAGKTLSFWIPLLMALEDGFDKMMFVVTPVNLLGKQNKALLEKAGLSAIAVSSKNANVQTFKDITEGKYCIIIINPEILMGNDNVEAWWKKPAVTKHVLNFMFDEGHCIKQWGSLCKEYMLLGNLRYLIPETIPFYVVSATLPTPILLDVVELLRLHPDATEQILCSNDRPEISIMVQGLKYPANSYKDLMFVISEGFVEGDTPPLKFLIFFDNTKEMEAACKLL
ncbi:hypothetical protein DXG01_015419 [Tephrocybe rancida]|nr:hypothetical protein DXG01_015419 [Tephrocybe rancida]